jgi:hypothetical protein
MGMVQLAEDLLASLELVEGKDIEEKVSRLIRANILLRLKECEEALFRFESKYAMEYDSFTHAWDEGEIAGKHSHEVERDFMEWEGFSLERRKLLRALRDLRLRTEG